jgi:hypothetical protein
MNLRPVAKVGLVAAGYAIAIAIAYAVAAARVAATSGPDRQTYAAMFDFGDSLLFLGVFGIAAVPATGAALFFLRPYRAFWFTLTVFALGAAGSGLLTFMDYVAPAVFTARSVRSLMALASLGIFVAPLFAMLFCLSALFAPHRFARRSLMMAAAVEISLCAYVAFTWFGPFRR